ncbi:hypothetical protein O1L44_30010 [Streptomyces noursei]|nr:hypothetical protein [Streptomyces noursei]
MTTTTTTFEGLALPHLAYGDAVHSMLDQTGLAPDVLETGLRVEDRERGPELFLTLSWLRGILTSPTRPASICSGPT